MNGNKMIGVMLRIVQFLLIFLPVIVYPLCGSVASYKQVNEMNTKSSSLGHNFFTKRTGDLFAVDIINSRLEEVLTKLSRDYKITFLLPSSLKDDEVMVRFSSLDLDRGIKKILAPYNTVFIYDEILSQSHSSGRTALKEVRIYISDLKSSREDPIITIQESGVNNRQVTAGQQKEDRVIKLKNTRNEKKGEGLPDVSDDLKAPGKDVTTDREGYPTEINSESTTNSLARGVTSRGGGLQKVPEENAVERSDDSAAINDEGIKTDEKNEKESMDNERDGDGGDNEDKGKDECGQVTAVCAAAEIKGDSHIVPIEVAGNRGDEIEAWGFDVDLKGFEYVEWVKSGCLAEESSSFMCNQLPNGKIRCGSYTGKLYIEGIQTLFKLHLKKDPNSKNSKIRLMNFVDNLASSRPSECSVE
jgi:hypothetical protein